MTGHRKLRPNQAERQKIPDLTSQFFGRNNTRKRCRRHDTAKPTTAAFPRPTSPFGVSSAVSSEPNNVSILMDESNINQSMKATPETEEKKEDSNPYFDPESGGLFHRDSLPLDRHTDTEQNNSICEVLASLGLSNRPQSPMSSFELEFASILQSVPPRVNANPFAASNRKKSGSRGIDKLRPMSFTPLEPFFVPTSPSPPSLPPSPPELRKSFSAAVSEEKLSPPTSSASRRQQVRKTDQMPPWWKTRAFSSATCYYPQNAKSKMAVGGLPPLIPPEIESFASPNFEQRADLAAKKERWARMKAKKKMLRRPVEVENFDDVDVEEEILGGKGVMLNHIIHQGSSGPYTDAELLRKYQQDVAYVKEAILKETEGNVENIRDLRFLLASVQTYGNIDGVCMVAEFAMNEFTLLSGIVERLHAIVGPWVLENETQRRRASRHAFETHQIPLQNSFATMSKKKLVEEILGRSEPSIAYRQGVKVGLYNDSCDEAFRVHLHLKNSFKDAGMVLDANERRFILVLQSEYHLMVESLKHLAQNVGLQYEGFPMTSERFIIVEAFVDAIAEILGETVSQDVFRWFGDLTHKNLESNVTPWEKNVDLICGRHAELKSACCAQAIACRTNFLVLHVLGNIFRRYHLRKFPAMRSLPSPVMSILPSLCGATFDLEAADIQI
ncbi:unnamed protein product [Caenorhabditis auriculariae]|uniref:Maelstrom domain-containing protein n=1 Tax=Caenorhabditis auriculariae TaxID=2777116 RepID=A0A8S1GZ54_9PELO|nr:unnamed protein product [Caenorhabditis auriculariae]